MAKCKKDADMKLLDTFSFRIPKHTKTLYEKLPVEIKHETQAQLRLVIAKAIHMAQFDPKLYLDEEAR